jgi:16S rRNA processing protein RimM
VLLTIESVRGDVDFPIVAFEEIPTRDKAEAFAGYVLEIEGSQLPELEEDEFYPFDLIGLEARDPSGSVMGRVTDALESAAHAILVIALPKGGEALAPFVKAAVPTVDLDAAYLVVDPEFVSLAGKAAAELDGEAAPPEAPGDEA